MANAQLPIKRPTQRNRARNTVQVPVHLLEKLFSIAMQAAQDGSVPDELWTPRTVGHYHDAYDEVCRMTEAMEEAEADERSENDD